MQAKPVTFGPSHKGVFSHRNCLMITAGSGLENMLWSWEIRRQLLDLCALASLWLQSFFPFVLVSNLGTRVFFPFQIAKTLFSEQKKCHKINSAVDPILLVPEMKFYVDKVPQIPLNITAVYRPEKLKVLFLKNSVLFLLSKCCFVLYVGQTPSLTLKAERIVCDCFLLSYHLGSYTSTYVRSISWLKIILT